MYYVLSYCVGCKMGYLSKQNELTIKKSKERLFTVQSNFSPYRRMCIYTCMHTHTVSIHTLYFKTKEFFPFAVSVKGVLKLYPQIYKVEYALYSFSFPSAVVM